jgi:drug/metabolite transporter (DMT)-like permease
MNSEDLANRGEQRADESRGGNGLSAHILPTSATMIGVCMTVLSIGHLGPHGHIHEMIDKLLAVDALVFLASALLSFMSMRSRALGSRHEAWAESVFITGLALLALGAFALAFAIA